MSNILIFKTSNDLVMNKFFRAIENSEREKYCLIQSSTFDSYQKKYPDITFIDIEKEGFYDISNKVISSISKIYFEKIYIVTSGVRAFNFENVIEIIDKLSYNELSFFNCNGEFHSIRKINKIYEYLIKKYIQIVSRLYIIEKG